MFYTRKHYYSINNQNICDLKMLNIKVKYTGGTHDSHVCNTSNVRPVMGEVHQRQGWVSAFNSSEVYQYHIIINMSLIATSGR